MLRVLQKNAPGEHEGVRIFELSKVFLQEGSGEGLPEEELHLTLMFTRKSSPVQWIGEQRPFDFFDMTGEAESILDYLGAPDDLRIEKNKNTPRSYIFNLLCNNQIIGDMGMFPSKVTSSFDIGGPVYFLDLMVDRISGTRRLSTTYSRISQFPAVKRDLSVVAQERITFADIRNIVKKKAKHLESMRLFDYYRGGHLTEGNRSYTFRLYFRSMEGTLDDRKVDKEIERILAGLKEELQVKLRSE
jgi:phenylalanyl-tRNA synthetase beta chain